MTKDELPPILWHYTTQAGLLGIIETGAMHASNIFYLNDATEYTYSFEMITQIIHEYLEKMFCGPWSGPELPPAWDEDKIIFIDVARYYFIQEIRQLLSNPETSTDCILSFSAKPDDLSQWRGYCSQGNGFAIGFNSADFLAQLLGTASTNSAPEEASEDYMGIINQYTPDFYKCLYESDVQESVIKKIIDGELEEFTSEFQAEDNKKIVVSRRTAACVSKMLRIIPQMKDISFKDEAEWRLVIRPFGGCSLKFRAGKSMLVPYVQIPLAEKNEDGERRPIKIIDSIIVGPTPHKALSKNSVEELMKLHGITLKTDESEGCEVKLSKIPYRIV